MPDQDLWKTVRSHLSRSLRKWKTPTAKRRPYPAAAPCVVGFLRSASGIGEAARLTRYALAENRIPHFSVDLSERYQPDEMIPADERFMASGDKSSVGPLVLHANPPEFWYAQSEFTRHNLSRRMRIGAWVWELSAIPRSWRSAASYLDEIWVPSEFCAKAFGSMPCPVRVVPHPILAGRAGHRSDSSQPDSGSNVTFLAVCDLRSSVARKNPTGAITAFKRAFDGQPYTLHEDPLLLLKVGGVSGNEDAFEELRQAAAHPRIRLLTKPLTRAAMDELIAACDVFVSLHRAEGFGLVVAQAMLEKKPVLVTDWSATRDFTDSNSAALVEARLVPVADPQNIYRASGAHWADPNLDVAADWMRRLAQDRVLRQTLGDRAAQIATQRFSAAAWWQNVGEPFRASCPSPNGL